jgi:cell division protein FtsZ
MQFELVDESLRQGARIKVVGLGGGGGNAINTMIRADLSGVEFVVANTDVQALGCSLAHRKLQIGSKLTKGLGAGANPDIGREAALETADQIAETLNGADMVFITAGLGGGTGTGAAPVVAGIARDLGILTVAVVTKPFGFEGQRRNRQAEEGLAELRGKVDTLITIPNQRLLGVVDKKTTLMDAFHIADDVLRQAVQGISDTITIPGLINLDFADVKTIMSGMGRAVMGTGISRGENRAVEAAQKAIASPLLEDGSIDGARGVLINVTGGPDLTLHEVNEASTIIQKASHEEAQIIFGAVVKESMDSDIMVTVIATGFEQVAAARQTAYAEEDVVLRAPVSLPFRKDREWPAFLRKRAVSNGDFVPDPGAGEEDLDIPTFLRKQAD